MKQLTKFMTRLRRRKPRRQDKHGSSMALVMIITSALVIWVMCLAPLMSTTGITALKVQNGYTDYLSSRSAIEYAKSELELIVRSEVPYTFAVIKQADGTYTTIRKVNEDDFNNPLYNDYVTCPSPSDDKQDVPNMGNKGADVAAICAVTPPVVGGTEYKILITTYNNGVKALSFNVIYTLNGSLLIYPEAYKQTDALPINDFVLVDGIMGGKYDANGNWVANTIWNSGITESTAESLGFTETMLPFLENPANGYADAREYPAVFKTTALPAKYEAGTTEVLKDPIKDEPYTSEEWILPFGVLDDNDTTNDSSVGAVHIGTYNPSYPGRYRVYLLDRNNTWQDITKSCVLYNNGEAVSRSNDYFDLSGIFNSSDGYGYHLTVNYSGTGSTYNATKLNALARDGMVVAENKGDPSKSMNNAAGSISPQLSVSVSNDGSTMTVTVTGMESGALYYSTSTDKWDPNNKFTITDFSRVYYFYAYMPAKMSSDGKITPASGVLCAGGVAGFKKYTDMSKLDPQKQYWIMSDDGYALMNNNNTLSSQKFISSGKATKGGYITFGTNTSSESYQVKWDNFKWNVGKNNTNDANVNLVYHKTDDNSQYLNFTYTLTANNYYNTNYAESYSESINLGLKDSPATVTLDNDNIYKYFNESRTVYDRDLKLTWGGLKYEYFPETKTYSEYAYLRLSNSGVGVRNSTGTSNNNTTVYFVEVPFQSAPKVIPEPSSVNDAGKTVTNDPNASAWKKLYANGKDITESGIASLKPGFYVLTGYSDTHFLLGQHAVYKTAPDADSVSITTIEQDSKNDIKVTVTASSSNGTDGGKRYIGYKRMGENDNAASYTLSDYFWFPAEGGNGTFTKTFYLEVGTDSQGNDIQYSFAFIDTGCLQNTQVISHSETTFSFITGSDFSAQNFLYYLNQDSSQDAGYSIFWYKMPTDEGVWPRKVHLKFKVAGEWKDSPGAEIDEYGITIDGSDYTGDKILVLSNPVGLTTENDRTSSMLSGASLYFMGGIDGSPSIDTYNNAIYLTTDLLVLNGDMAMSGSTENGVLSAIYVYPYKANDVVDENRNTTNTKVLLFAASDVKNPKGEVIFNENCFYEIPSGTNIFNLPPQGKESAPNSCYFGASDPNNAAAMDSVKAKFKEKKYPEISFDIAFATKKQLSHLISSETWGWTVSGIMKTGESGDFNEGYAVCLYVNDTESGVITRNANRVLVAAAENSGRIFTVRNKMSFTTRYFSIDASVIQQADSNASLTIYNLGQSSNYSSYLFELLDWDYCAYRSKTLQIDYERHTTLKLADGRESFILPQVCRYDDVADENGVQMGADLFTVNMENLLTPYTVTEIEDLRASIDKVWGIGDRALIKTVDRYIQLSGDGENTTLDLYANLGVDYQVFANYVYIDSTVTAINITRRDYSTAFVAGEEGGMVFNTQERGYDAVEYISFFKDPSVEAFTGTIIRVEAPIYVTYSEYEGHIPFLGYFYDKHTQTLPAGYYYINANQYPDGVSLKDIVKNPAAFSIAESTLRDTAVEIDPDNSNAFIDSGLQGGTFGKAQGFSGGTVQ